MTVQTNIDFSGAKWWWPNGVVPNIDEFADFATDITMPNTAKQAWIAVTCGSWYSLWVNGELISHGPPREVSPWQYFDTVDLTPVIKPRTNRIRIRAYHLGVDTQFHAACMAGLMLVGEIRAEGLLINLGEASIWRAAKSPAYLPGGPRLHACLGFGEHANLTENTDDWLSRKIDSSWKKPAVVGTHPLAGRENLIPSDLPPLSGRILEAAISRQLSTWNVWDFGGEVFGYLDLKVESDQAATCTLLHGDSLTSAGLPDYNFSDGDFREILELPSGVRRWKAFEKRALRYIALPSCIRVHRIAIRESSWPLKEVWGDLPGLKNLSLRDKSIIKAAARTVVLCCDWCCPLNRSIHKVSAAG